MVFKVQHIPTIFPVLTVTPAISHSPTRPGTMPATSSVSDEAPTYTAEDLLSLDDGQFTEFLKRCERPEGGYDISSASDLHLMVESRRQLLFERLRYADFFGPLVCLYMILSSNLE